MTKTDKTMLDDTELDLVFQAAKARALTPSEALLTRIMDDAAAQIAPPLPRAQARPRAPIWARVFTGLGGWPVMVGMASAAIAGIGIGFTTPGMLDTLSGGVLSAGAETSAIYELEDLVPGYDIFSGLQDEG